MENSFDKEKTLELIQQLKSAKIGENNKWNAILKKLNQNLELNEKDIQYFSTLTRIYKDGRTSARSKFYHVRLSEDDSKPPCKNCGNKSQFYCNLNDEYFCSNHICGHDENEN